MKIGIDIDGTLSKTFEKYLAELNKQGYDVSFDDWTTYHYLKDEETTKALQDWYQSKRQELRRSYDIREGARAIINYFADAQITYITARLTEDPSCQATIDWLKRHNIAHPVIHSEEKVGEAEDLGLDIFIEDAPHTALAIANVGIPVLLYDMPWNKDIEHPLIFRFTHWLEVPMLIRRAMRK